MSALQAFKTTSFSLVWNVGILLFGIVIAAKALDVNFGRVSFAILKLAAISIGPLGVSGLIRLATDDHPIAIAIGWCLSVPMYWGLFSYLFDLDVRETIGCVVLTTTLRWVSYFIYWMHLKG